jgi:hypothetical protein
MEAVGLFVAQVNFYKNKRCHIQENNNLLSYHRENLKSKTSSYVQMKFIQINLPTMWAKILNVVRPNSRTYLGPYEM